MESLPGVVLYDKQKILVKHRDNKPCRVFEVRPRTLIEKQQRKPADEGGEQGISEKRWSGASSGLNPGDLVTVKVDTASSSSSSAAAASTSSFSSGSKWSRALVALSVEVNETGRLLPELSDEDILRIQAFKFPQWLGPSAAIEQQYCGLPVELMLQVFSHLKARDFHSCMLTCKSWHLLARDQSLDALWLSLTREELLRRMLARARSEIKVIFRAVDRYQEMRHALSKNVPHLLKKTTDALKSEGIEKGNLLTFTLLFQRLPERDGPRDYIQPFASLNRVFDFIVMISTKSLDLNALLSRFGQESTVLGRTSFPLQNPIRDWLTQRESKRNLLMAVCRHFASRTRAVNAVLMLKPHLFPRFVNMFGADGLQQDEAYWLFEFADYAAECPSHLREWIKSKFHRTKSLS